MPKRNAIWILAVAMLVLMFSQLPTTIARRFGNDGTYKDLDAFAEVLYAVRKHYVSKFDEKKAFNAAVGAYLRSLDKFSSYIPQLKEFDQRTRGFFGGIGIQINVEEDLLTVVSPLDDTPAFQAGVLSGDKIIKIDGKSIRINEDYTIEDAVRQLTGEPGTKVTITVRRLSGKEDDIPLIRARIKVKSVKGWVRNDEGLWDYMVDKAAGIAYVRVSSFVETTDKDLRAAVDKLVKKERLRGLILDLRFNPGGLLTGAVKMGDLFLSEGVIVSTRGRGGADYSEVTAHRHGTEPDFPIIVLVNKYSASAAEIVSGALRDHKRALLVGSRTYGKGTVQTVIPIQRGKAAIKLTTAHYYLPSGRNIHKVEGATQWGVEPHVIVEMTDNERAAIMLQRRDADVIKTADAETQPATRPATQPATQPSPQAASRPVKLAPGEMDKQLKRAVELLREKLRQKTAGTAYDKLLRAG